MPSLTSKIIQLKDKDGKEISIKVSKHGPFGLVKIDGWVNVLHIPSKFLLPNIRFRTKKWALEWIRSVKKIEGIYWDLEGKSWLDIVSLDPKVRQRAQVEMFYKYAEFRKFDEKNYSLNQKKS